MKRKKITPKQMITRMLIVFAVSICAAILGWFTPSQVSEPQQTEAPKDTIDAIIDSSLKTIEKYDSMISDIKKQLNSINH
jgi:hypothetical protein